MKPTEYIDKTISEETNPYKAELTKLEEEFGKKVDALAQKIHDEVVVPFCKKYKCKFGSGMGTWDFEDDKTGKDIAYVLEYLKEDQDGLQEYKRVASIMDMQANLNYITDYGIGTITPPYKRKVT